ncbi:hypothetical protein HK104_008585 [Borealophlyctis nickersoniae]|nr:hypothetical protein HK104_008585 [Borealophlyctis nickersoniae]
MQTSRSRLIDEYNALIQEVALRMAEGKLGCTIARLHPVPRLTEKDKIVLKDALCETIRSAGWTASVSVQDRPGVYLCSVMVMAAGTVF